MEKKKILNILFWILLIVVAVLVLWRILGDSPSDLQIIIPVMLMLLVKLWSVSDDLQGFKHEVKASFANVKTDIDEIKNKKRSKK